MTEMDKIKMKKAKREMNEECDRKIKKLIKVIELIIRQLEANGHKSLMMKKAKKQLRMIF